MKKRPRAQLLRWGLGCIAFLLLFCAPRAARAAGSLELTAAADPALLPGRGTVTVTIAARNTSLTQSVSDLSLWYSGRQIVASGAVRTGSSNEFYAEITIEDKDLGQDLEIVATWFETAGTARTQFSDTIRFTVAREENTTLTLTSAVPSVVSGPAEAITPIYTLENIGKDALINLILTDEALGVSVTIERLEPGELREIIPPQLHLSQDTVSHPVVTYTIEGSATALSVEKPPVTIALTKGQLILSVTAAPAEVHAGEGTLIVFTMTNDGKAALKDLRVTCEELGGKMYEMPLLQQGSGGFTRRITPLSTARYVFTVTGRDSSGKEIVPQSCELIVSVLGARQRKVSLTLRASSPVTQLAGPGEIEISALLRNNNEETLYDVVVTDPVFGEIGSISALPPHVEKTLLKTVTIEQTVELNFTASARFKNESPVAVTSEALRISVAPTQTSRTSNSAGHAAATQTAGATPATQVTPSGSSQVLLITAAPSNGATVPSDASITPEDGDGDGLPGVTLAWIRTGAIVLSALVAMCAVVFVVLIFRRRRG